MPTTHGDEPVLEALARTLAVAVSAGAEKVARPICDQTFVVTTQ
jgi:methyl coenzyme M reductase subunit C